MIKKHTTEELRQIAEERELWAKQAHERDLHGSATEWELTASIARQCIRMRTECEEWKEKFKAAAGWSEQDIG